MARRNKEEQMRANLEEVGINEEDYWRYWYNLYHVNMQACNPMHPAVLKKYANMPEKWRRKFLWKNMRTKNNIKH